jgi:hypothetical protein
MGSTDEENASPANSNRDFFRPLQGSGAAGWRMASAVMRLAILGACADTFSVLIDARHFDPYCLDHFRNAGAALALRQPRPIYNRP